MPDSFMQTISESRTAQLKSEYDIVVRAPASFFLVGEYSVLYGKPAIVMPIPLYVQVGMKLKSGETFDLSEGYRPSDLDCRNPVTSISRVPRTGEQARDRILRTIKKHMADNFHCEPNGISAETISDIPTMCGLGSSGAFSACISLAVHALMKPDMIEAMQGWGKLPLKLLISTPEFSSVFRLAWDIEKILHGTSSGCGPFASLVGSTDSLPLIYCVLDEQAHQIFGDRISELIKTDTDLLLNTLWNDSGVAIVFSGQERGSSEQAITNARLMAKKIENGLYRMKRQVAITRSNGKAPVEFGVLTDLEAARSKVSSDLWNTFSLIFIGCMTNLLSCDISDLKRMVNLAQSLLSFLQVSTPEIDKFALACNSQYGTSCKITGSGRGGDVLLFGEKSSVISCVDNLVQERRALHYASWLDPRSDHRVEPATTVWYRSDTRSPPIPPITQRLPPKADFAIITALDKEFDAVKSIFGIHKDDFTKEGTIYYHYGEVETSSRPARRHFVVCARCTVTGIRAAQALTESVLKRWKPTHVLLVGTAGGVKGREGIELGHVIVSRNVIHDEQKQIKGRIEFYNPPCEAPSSALLKTAGHIMSENWQIALPPRPDGRDPKSSKVIPGEIISGDRLRGDPNYPELKTILEHYPRADAFEMEAGGVSYAVWDSDPKLSDYFVIKGITDFVNVSPRENQETRDKWREYASKAAASFAYFLVQKSD